MLQAVGVTAGDEAVYRQLLLLGTASVTELADQSDASPDRIERALDRLLELGLVSTLTATPRRFVASPPDVAIEVLVRAQEGRLAEARRAAKQLATEYQPVSSHDPLELIEVITGHAAVGQRFRQLEESVEHDMMIFDLPPYANDVDNLESQVAALGRGVYWRAVYAPEALQVPDQLGLVRHLVGHGEQARTLPDLPMKLAIADRRVAMIPLSMDQADHSAVIVHPSTLLDALVSLFETLWRRAVPLLAGRVSGSADADVLAMLSAGLTDATIARRLGVSTRTVRRRVALILEHLDAGSRFQAGVQAARRGWL